MRYRDYARQLRGMSSTPQAGTAQAAVRDLLKKAAPGVPDLLGGGHESWNGQVSVFPSEDNPGVVGELTWQGRMNIEEKAAEAIQDTMEHPDKPVSDPAAFEVILHELTHGVIGGRDDKRRAALGLSPVSGGAERYYDHSSAYQEETVAQIEEGFTELGGIHHAPEFFKAIGIGNREVEIPSDVIYNPAGGYRQSMTGLALLRQDPVRVGNGQAWGHYAWQTRMAQDWVQQVAQDEGHSDLRISTPGYARTRELADEVNREGAAGKIGVMANQVVRAALRNTPEAPLLKDQDAMDKVLRSTREAIREAWAGEQAATDAHRAAVKIAKTEAHTVAVARLAAERRTA